MSYKKQNKFNNTRKRGVAGGAFGSTSGNGNAGDDADAKAVVSKLIDEIGFTPIDIGSLREGGRKQQPGSSLYNHPMTVEVAYKRLAELD
jgi:predicted dinucleotide-binding enzyme